MNSSLLCVCLALALPVGQAPPPPVALVPAPVPGIALSDFAKAFVPAAGNYEVVLLHPKTCCPVKVCFTLPCGCPKVRVTKRSIVFDYGKHAVRIRFPILGDGAKVTYT
jgi:hypothetical protein